LAEEGKLIGFYREDTGEKLLIPEELWAALQAEIEVRIEAQKIAKAERQRAERESQQAEQERQRAEQERQRAEQAEQIAGQERQRAEQLVAQLRALGIEPET
jgi:membrane protein involved in colicin uptake